MRYGIYLQGMLMQSYESPKEALDSAVFALQETGVFHEVKVIENEKEINK